MPTTELEPRKLTKYQEYQFTGALAKLEFLIQMSELRVKDYDYENKNSYAYYDEIVIQQKYKTYTQFLGEWKSNNKFSLRYATKLLDIPAKCPSGEFRETRCSKILVSGESAAGYLNSDYFWIQSLGLGGMVREGGLTLWPIRVYVGLLSDENGNPILGFNGLFIQEYRKASSISEYYQHKKEYYKRIFRTTGSYPSRRDLDRNL